MIRTKRDEMWDKGRSDNRMLMYLELLLYSQTITMFVIGILAHAPSTAALSIGLGIIAGWISCHMEAADKPSFIIARRRRLKARNVK